MKRIAKIKITKVSNGFVITNGSVVIIAKDEREISSKLSENIISLIERTDKEEYDVTITVDL